MKHSRMWIPDEGQSTKNNREIINPLYQLWLEFFSHGAVLWKIGMRGRYGSCHHLTEQVREAKILPTMTKDTRRLQTHKCTHNNTHTHTHRHTHTAIPMLQQKRKQLFRSRARDMMRDNMEILRVAASLKPDPSHFSCNQRITWKTCSEWRAPR